MGKKIFNVVYYFMLLSSITLFLLNTFVLEEDANIDALEVREEVKITDAVIEENHYKDDNIEITINDTRKHKTNIHTADIILTSPEYLRTAFAKNTYGRNVKQDTSDIAAANHAILAINGDFYGARQSGFVVREYKQFRNTIYSYNREDLVMYQDGSFDIITETTNGLKQLKNPRNVWSFGPGLIKKGKIAVTVNQEITGAHRINNPRTAIGIIDKNHYVFVVSDGRTSESQGLSLYELAEHMKELGCTTAYNLDGGGSSTMVYNGRIINKPTHTGGKITERKVSDIVYIGY